MTEKPQWGKGIVLGAKVTSKGHHGAGQPPIVGIVRHVLAHGDIIVETKQGNRHRSIRNLRLLKDDE